MENNDENRLNRKFFLLVAARSCAYVVAAQRLILVLFIESRRPVTLWRLPHPGRPTTAGFPFDFQRARVVRAHPPGVWRFAPGQDDSFYHPLRIVAILLFLSTCLFWAEDCAEGGLPGVVFLVPKHSEGCLGREQTGMRLSTSL